MDTGLMSADPSSVGLAVFSSCAAAAAAAAEEGAVVAVRVTAAPDEAFRGTRHLKQCVLQW